ncbi:chromate transporter [Acetanaerobacterium elongatum]|uniref:Chromate transporter n=1 Tax=Acetanaerobacterium elongatum TaxID=258515 RepID=A0A1H0GIE5_9FIRM|nr:chromate transporter [Acetanaerobacterium elongatum]SDO06648.1 chromate transporter [Acetanaerobacterium elongatum]
MKKDAKFYLKLFLSTFAISAFTIGGGYVIVTLMKKKFVEQYHWITEEEMLDFTAIAQSSPGVIAVNASILVGYRLAGILGALVAITGTVLPPLILLSVITLFYEWVKDNEIIKAMLKGMQAGVGAVIAEVVINMTAGIFKQKKVYPIAVMLIAFTAAFFFNVSVILIIIVCALLGAVTTLYTMRKEKRATGR